jgi:hypothetical protein
MNTNDPGPEMRADAMRTHEAHGAQADVKVSVMLPRWAVTAVDERARRSGLSRSSLIRVIVEEWLARG